MSKPNSDCRATECKRPWPMVRLGDVCEDKIQRIKSISEPRIAYIDIASIDNAQKQIIGVKEYDVDDAPGRAQQVVIPGDVLVSNVRPNLNAVAIVDVVSAIPIVASTGFCVLRVKDIALPEYVYYYAQTSDFIDPLVAVSEKASYPSVTDTIVKDSLMSLPPLSIQREVVARLERELAAVEKMKNGFEALAETAKAEFKAELKEVFEEISRGGAETRRLGEICENLDSKRVPITKSDREAGKYPYYGASGVVDWVSGYIFDGDYLLVSEDGANLIARSAPIAFSVSGKIWVNNHAHILAFSDLATQRFVEFYFASIKIEELVKGAAQPKLTQKALNSIAIPLPPLSIQREVVARLDSAKVRAEKLEAKAREGVAVCETMRKAILKEAFAPCCAGEVA